MSLKLKQKKQRRATRLGRLALIFGLLISGFIVLGQTLVAEADDRPVGTVTGWGSDSNGEINVPVTLNNVVAIAAGSAHSLALKSDGTVVAWGNNYYGQTSIPTGLSNVIAITAGQQHSLALKKDGTVVGWGSNNYGQTTIPTGLSNVVAIAGGGYHSLALKSDGTVVGWGRNDAGQSKVPTGLSNVTAISAGGLHSLALKKDGSVVGWGSNFYSQSGPPDFVTNVVAISAGGFHNLALKKDGSVVAWGYNGFGQTNLPAAAMMDVVAISAGKFHNLALKTNGSVVAWGYNGTGQSNVPKALNSVIAIAAGEYQSLALVKTTPQSQQIDFPQPADHTYGDAAFSLNATASSSLTVSYASNTSFVCTVSGNTVTIVATGSCSITASQAGNPNYSAATPVTRSFKVNRATPKISVTGGSFTYNEQPHPATATVEGVGGAIIPGMLTLTYNPGGSNPPVAVGSYGVTASFTSRDANYNNASGTGTITINPASQTLTFNVPAFNYYPYPSGNNTFTVGATASSGQPVSFSASGVCTVSNTTVTVTGIGACIITASLTGNNNNSVTPVSRIFQSVPNPTGFALLALGPVNMTSTQTQGPIAALGNGTFLGTNIAYGSKQANALMVQGSVSFGNWGNQVNGNVVYSGSLLDKYVTFQRGGLVQNANALGTAVKDYALKVSAAWAALPANGTVDYKPWNQIILTGTSTGQNVFNLDGSRLATANSLSINAPSGATVIINISGTSDRLQYMGISLNGPVANRVVYNFYQATALTINGVGMDGTVWAPQAAVNFNSVSMSGSVVAGNMTNISSNYQDAPFQGTLPAVQ